MANWREFKDFGGLAVVYKTFMVSDVVDVDDIQSVYDLDVALGGSALSDFIDDYGIEAFKEYRDGVDWDEVHPASEFYVELRSYYNGLD